MTHHNFLFCCFMQLLTPYYLFFFVLISIHISFFNWLFLLCLSFSMSCVCEILQSLFPPYAYQKFQLCSFSDCISISFMQSTCSLKFIFYLHAVCCPHLGCCFHNVSARGHNSRSIMITTTKIETLDVNNMLALCYLCFR